MRADLGGLGQAPMLVASEEGACVRRQVIAERHALAGPARAKMRADVAIVLVQHDHGIGGLPVMSFPGSGILVASGGFPVSTTTVQSQGNGQVHTHGITTDGAHQHNLNINPIPAHQHTISQDGAHNHTVTTQAIPPFFALAYIMKIS